MNKRTLLGLVTALALLASACGGGGAATDGAATDGAATGLAPEGSLSGGILIDGSSTVGPLTDAIAAGYARQQPDVDVDLQISGTGGGFERFCGEGATAISNASRPISEEEIALCESNGISFIEVRVGTDALTMVTNPANAFLECLDDEQITALWGAETAAATWDQVDPSFPAEPVRIFAPGSDSGTYDFFNETTLPGEGDPEAGGIPPRQDYQASEDDNIVAQGIQGEVNSWGYFGFAYYVGNADELKAIAYDAGDGCVEPSVESAEAGEYGLSRPLFIYVKEQSLQEEEHVADFVRFYLQHVADVISDVGYIPAPAEQVQESVDAIESAIGG